MKQVFPPPRGHAREVHGLVLKQTRLESSIDMPPAPSHILTPLTGIVTHTKDVGVGGCRVFVKGGLYRTQRIGNVHLELPR
mmetsp:Transcript_25392/g.29269  ORF Transcript_25392/g.29269 Transcript_25392/m.29269 type:complete len:81 (-) Transcript_25392:120-362(-)